LRDIPVLKTKPVPYPAGTPAYLFAKRAVKTASGFTLLEVMVSLSVIAIALTAIYSNYNQTISMSIAQKFNTTAPLLAATIVTDFESRPLMDLTDDSGDFGPEFEGYAWEVVVETIVSETLGTIAEDIRGIGITVTLNDGEQIFHSKTFRFMRNGAQK